MYYEFTYNNKTNCLMLNHNNELIDYKFYNSFESITLDKLYKNSKQIAKDNNINEYAVNFLNVKEG